MPKPKVFVFAPILETDEWQQTFEEAGCELVLGRADWHNPLGDNEDEMIEMAKGAVAMMGTSIRSCPITTKIMDAAGPGLRVISKCTIGVDDVDVAGATAKNIMVTHAPTESNWGGVAEGTMAMMLAMLKKTRERDAAMKRGEWRDPALTGTYLGRRQDGYEGITIGIIVLRDHCMRHAVGIKTCVSHPGACLNIKKLPDLCITDHLVIFHAHQLQR